jgi:ribosomal protein S6
MTLKTYDSMFIFEETLRDEALDQVLDNVNGEIKRVGGEITASRILGRRTFARPMKKRESGVYVRLILSLPSDQIATLRHRLAIREDVVRAQIVVGDEKTTEFAELCNRPPEAAEAPAEEAAAKSTAG